MANEANNKIKPQAKDVTPILKWAKIITRITAIGATVAGAVAALFSSSSVTTGIALSAAGAGTLAAAEKIPNPRYARTKHVPPRTTMSRQQKILAPDILPRAEKIDSSSAELKRERFMSRPLASYETIKPS